VNTGERVSINSPSGLDTPFLTQELFAAQVDEDRQHRVSTLMSEGAFRPSVDRVDDRNESREFDETEAAPDLGGRDFAEEEQPQRVRFFRIIDGAEKPKPLTDARYELHQGNKSDAGTLNSKGEGPFARVDPERPFRLHVEGRVCAIVEGAVLLVDDPDVEYGGQFVDWRLADGANADSEFWPHYTAERTAPATGPFRFWQHDHIIRRPIKLRRAFVSTSKAPVFQAVALRIRVGPLVRFVNESCALIWVELETPGLVQIRFRKAADHVGVPRAGSAIREVDLNTRYSSTVTVGGRYFALVQIAGLEADTFYQYTLDLAPLPPTGDIPQGDRIATVFPASLPAAVQGVQAKQLAAASFRNDRWLFFRTLQRDYQQLRFAHGSCRKWPNDADQDGNSPGPDMLDIFGPEWLAKQKVLSEWPRFFLHTGDQIYADDVGVKQGDRIMAQRFGSIVPGPRSGTGLEEGAWAGRFADRYVAISAQRTAQAAAPTQALRERVKQLEPVLAKAKKEDRVDRETIKLAREYQDARKALAQQPGFQRAWNFVDPKRPMRFRQRVENALLWNVPVDKSGSPEVSLTGLRHRDRQRSYYPSAGETNAVHAADFAEYSYLYDRAWSLDGARKVLAHLPSFMIFDDHEITDDWNFNGKWVDIVHSNEDDPYQMWPKTITDGLVAYWMYQGWGNLAPSVWRSDPRVQILDRARAAGKDALPDLRRLIFERAIKPARPGVDPTKRLTWYYSLPIRSPQFLVVDDRSEREVYGTGGPFQKQLEGLNKRLDEERSSAAFIVFPTPFLLPHPLSWAMTHQSATRFISFLAKLFRNHTWEWTTIEALARDSDMEHAAGNRVWEHVMKMLVKIQDSVTPLKTIAFVSGDIHFSCNLDGQLKKFDPAPQPHLLQLVSSGLRQAVPSAKQSQLQTAYDFFHYKITGLHRGLSVRLGGLDGPGHDDPNFLFPTSVALVDVDVRNKKNDPRIEGYEVPNVSIHQQHLIWKPKSGRQAGRIESYHFYYANNETTGPKLLTPGRMH
jgi:hypothetical protein